MTEKFNLTWHTYQSHTSDMMSNLYNTSSFSDVTLICDDKTQFKAHKFVLSSGSSVLRSILENSVDSPYIYLRGIAREEMEAILHFMYLGEATFYEERMKEFINVARDLDVKEIRKKIEGNEAHESSEEETYDISERMKEEHIVMNTSVYNTINTNNLKEERNNSYDSNFNTFLFYKRLMELNF